MPDWMQDVRSRLAPLALSPAREAEIIEELSSIVLASAAVLASYLPTRRAVAVDPVETMKAE